MYMFKQSFPTPEKKMCVGIIDLSIKFSFGSMDFSLKTLWNTIIIFCLDFFSNVFFFWVKPNASFFHFFQPQTKTQNTQGLIFLVLRWQQLYQLFQLCSHQLGKCHHHGDYNPRTSSLQLLHSSFFQSLKLL